MKRLGADFYDEQYFVGEGKSNYLRLNPDGGYTRRLYLIYKQEQIKDVLALSGYTQRWRPKNACVLGCAVGYLVEAMQMDGKTDAYGLDISEYAIKRGTEEGIKNLIVGDMCSLPYDKDEFELVIAFEVIEHIPEDDGQLAMALDEMVRICNGYIVISTPSADDDENPDQSDGDDPSHFSVHTQQWWATQFEKRGAQLFYQKEANNSNLMVFEVK